MHGIQHLFRQHALDKQSSVDSWQATAVTNQAHHNQLFGKASERSLSGESGENIEEMHNRSSSPQSVPNSQISSPSQEFPFGGNSSGGGSVRSRKTSNESRCSSNNDSSSGIRKMSKRSARDGMSPGYPTTRRSSLDSSSPPVAPNAAYFPHDLDDIYEYKTDHQYFTHTGAYNDLHPIPISSDYHRNLIFQRNNGVQSLDEYASGFASPGINRYNNIDNNKYLNPRHRFDNTSFIRKLSSSISQNSIDSSLSQSPSKSNEKRAKSQNHSSIHEMIKQFGKKVHIWPSRTRHDSINDSSNSISIANENDQENFRRRAVSLDQTIIHRKPNLDDCEATYKIYNKILHEAHNSIGHG